MKPHIYLLVIIGLLAGLHRAAAQGFVLSSSPGVGNFPYSIAAADVNGDGKLDLICANYFDNTLMVLTNNGNGNFGSNATYTVGSNPSSVVAADVNGDGKVDLICANGGNGSGNTLTVLTNNGNGIFGSNATYIVGGYPTSVTAADVNGDGKLDLICANFDNDTLTVLTNNGNGGFLLSGTYGVDSGPFCVTAADVNGDGKLDLISANLNTNTLTVLTNNGNGGFVLLLSGSYAVCAYDPNVASPASVTAADINGDGKVDLISANIGLWGGGKTLTVLTNNGSGGFGSNAIYTLNGPRCVVAADVNGDGKVDLITANEDENPILTVLTNDGSGGFVVAFSLGTGSSSISESQSVVVADVNGDGKLDLVCANEIYLSSSNTLIVLTNALTFQPPTSTPPLTIKRSGDNARVSWPSASAGWSLQQNPDLTTPYWVQAATAATPFPTTAQTRASSSHRNLEIYSSACCILDINPCLKIQVWTVNGLVLTIYRKRRLA